jgi:hypothetical protein
LVERSTVRLTGRTSVRHRESGRADDRGTQVLSACCAVARICGRRAILLNAAGNLAAVLDDDDAGIAGVFSSEKVAACGGLRPKDGV